MTHSLVIVGTGWLGKPLAQELLKRGETLVAVTTSTEREIDLRASNIPVVNEPLTQWASLPVWKNATVVVTWPPMTNDPDGFSRHRQLSLVLGACRPKRILITSSTSVYKDVASDVLENGEIQTSASMAQVESVYSGIEDTTFLRLGGLIGPGRHPGQFFAGKKIIPQPNAPVNLVHQSDVIASILFCLLSTDPLPAAINVVHPDHPTRGEFYLAMAAKLGLTLQLSDAPDQPMNGKKVLSGYLEKAGFAFAHPALLDYF